MKFFRDAFMSGIAMFAFNAAAAPLYNGPSYPDIEKSFNSEKVPRIPKIVLLDGVEVLRQAGSEDNLAPTIDKILRERTGVEYSPKRLSMLAKSVAGRNPNTISVLRMNPQALATIEEQACAAVGYPQDVPAPEFIMGLMIVKDVATGKMVDLMEGKRFNLDIGFDSFIFLINAHELWHCLDTRYTPLIEDAEGQSISFLLHRSEVFADLGGVMEAVRAGADMAFVEAHIDLRAAREGLTSVLLPTQGDNDFYPSIYYGFAKPLNVLKDRIEGMGVEEFRALSRAEMRDIAYDIADKFGLDSASWNDMKAYYAQGVATSYAPQAQEAARRMNKIVVRKP